jgi:hypothetical protein
VEELAVLQIIFEGIIPVFSEGLLLAADAVKATMEITTVFAVITAHIT